MALTQAQRSEAGRRAIEARGRRIAGRTLTYAFMLFLGFLFLFPIIFMIVAAFKPNDRVIADLASIRAFLPDLSTLTLDNVRDVFSRVPFDLYMFNSLFMTLITVIAGLFVNSMAAYVLARLRWRARAVVLGLVVSLIIIPLEAIAVPLMMQVNEMTFFLNLIVLLLMVLLTGLIWLVLWNSAGSWVTDRLLPASSRGCRSGSPARSSRWCWRCPSRYWSASWCSRSPSAEAG